MDNMYNTNNNMNIDNIEILNIEEPNNWKINNLPIKEYNISVVFPKTAHSETISNIISKLNDIVELNIKEVYIGSQIELGR